MQWQTTPTLATPDKRSLLSVILVPGIALAHALKATDRTSLPDLAATHYRAGMAMQALGKQSSANEHFKRAMELDPAGRRGTLAKAALRDSKAVVG